MRPQDMLGNAVKLEAKSLENDKWAQNMLKDLGLYFSKNDNEHDNVYLGSFAVHIYKSKDLMTSDGKYGAAMVNQFNLNDTNEYLVMMAVNNLGVEIAKKFGRKHKTTDQNDKRGVEL